MLAGLVGGHVVGHVGDKRGGDGGLDDRGAVDAHEPEEAHGAVDDGQADVAVGGGEERLEDLDDALGKGVAKGRGEGDAHDPENGAADRERDDVLEGLRDVGRDLLGHLDGDVAANEELVHDAHDKSRDKRREKTLGAHVGDVQAGELLGGVGDHVAGEQQEADDGRAHARDEVDLVVLGQVAVLRVAEVLGRGGRAGDGEDAHRVVVGLPQPAVELLGPVEAPDVGDGRDQAEDGREDDDGDDRDKAVANGLEVLVARDRVEEGLALLDGRDELFHACSLDGWGPTRPLFVWRRCHFTTLADRADSYEAQNKRNEVVREQSCMPGRGVCSMATLTFLARKAVLGEKFRVSLGKRQLLARQRSLF